MERKEKGEEKRKSPPERRLKTRRTQKPVKQVSPLLHDTVIESGGAKVRKRLEPLPRILRQADLSMRKWISAEQNHQILLTVHTDRGTWNS